VSGAVSSAMKWPKREAGHSFESTAVEMRGAMPSNFRMFYHVVLLNPTQGQFCPYIQHHFT
jgi:hypothetical protein